MSAEYPAAQWAPIPGFGFPMGSHGGNTPLFIILHGTASGDGTAQQQVAFFQGDNQHGVHFVIGKDGAVFQMVQLADAAYGNCCVDPAPAHAAFWDTILQRFSNLNTCTISIEHCKIAADNSDILTPAQQRASFALVAWLCKTLNIPARDADVNGGITGHFSMNGINRANCPGVYPWQQLWTYLSNGGLMVPANWSYDQLTNTLHNSQNQFVVQGANATHILNSLYWSEGNIPVTNEIVQPDGSTQQYFRYSRLDYSAATGTVEAWVGQGLMDAEAEIATLKAAPPPAPVPVADPKAAAAKAALQAWLAE